MKIYAAKLAQSQNPHSVKSVFRRRISQLQANTQIENRATEFIKYEEPYSNKYDNWATLKKASPSCLQKL